MFNFYFLNPTFISLKKAYHWNFSSAESLIDGSFLVSENRLGSAVDDGRQILAELGLPHSLLCKQVLVPLDVAFGSGVLRV